MPDQTDVFGPPIRADHPHRDTIATMEEVVGYMTPGDAMRQRLRVCAERLNAATCSSGRYAPVVGVLQAILEAGDRPVEDLPRILLDQLQRHAERGNRAAELDALIAELADLADLAMKGKLGLEVLCERLQGRVRERADLDEAYGEAPPETVTILASDAARAVRILREVVDTPNHHAVGHGPHTVLDDIADLLTPGSWGADGTPYETVRGRVRDGLPAEHVAARVHGDPLPEAPIVVAVRPGTGMLARRMSDGRWYVLDAIPGGEPLHDAEVGELQEYEVCRDGVSTQ